jgi:hypothetical protein
MVEYPDEHLTQIIAELQECPFRSNSTLQNLHRHPEVLDIDFNFLTVQF